MDIRFRIAARCEAAGRPNNEDNYQICDDLQAQHWGFTANAELQLSDKGSLLVVCDGMGGMNAGEVASAIAVDTIKQCFSLNRLTDAVTASSSNIRAFIVDAIQAADAAIKTDGANNPEHQGMGSTIVLAWLLGDKVYIGWCGDSRIYRYNPINGFERLSHDHSYVQELVDAGKLTEELAFDHPNNNIITRSLGDPNGVARPDTAEFPLFNDDILLLCSDGLCGTLRDNEIQQIIANNQTSMTQCRDVLWAEDEKAGWHDNVTIVLAQILSGAAVPIAPMPTPIPDSNRTPNQQGQNNMSDSKAELKRKNKILVIALCCLIGLLIAGAGVFAWLKFGRPNEGNNKQSVETQNEASANPDSAVVSNIDTVIVDNNKIVAEHSQKITEEIKKVSEPNQQKSQQQTQSTLNPFSAIPKDNSETINEFLENQDGGNSDAKELLMGILPPKNETTSNASQQTEEKKEEVQEQEPKKAEEQIVEQEQNEAKKGTKQESQKPRDLLKQQ